MAKIIYIRIQILKIRKGIEIEYTLKQYFLTINIDNCHTNLVFARIDQTLRDGSIRPKRDLCEEYKSS